MQCLSRNTVPSRARHLTAHQSTLPAPVPSRQSTVRQTVCLATTPPSTGSQPLKQEPEDDFQGLLPEEDFEVPGSYFDALTSSTKLGKAVKSAVKELEHLGNLEAEVLSECDDLLKQLGMKGSLFGAGDNPLAKLQQELAELEKLEQQELEKQQQQQQQQQGS